MKTIFAMLLLISALPAHATTAKKHTVDATQICVVVDDIKGQVGFVTGDIVVSNTMGQVGYLVGNVVVSTIVGQVGYETGNVIVSNTAGQVGFIIGNVIVSNVKGQIGFGASPSCSSKQLAAAALLLF